MTQKLSKRLQAAADFVTPGSRVADVGTDHGHLPIYLIQCGRCPCAVAMDIRSGPLQRADEHIRSAGLTGSIQTRLSDGLKELMPGEADSVVIAGMGGLTVINILEASFDIVQGISELILAPQSDIAKVRRFLREHGMLIDRENLVLEDSKFYPILHVVKNENDTYKNAGINKYKKMQELLYKKLQSQYLIGQQERALSACDQYRTGQQETGALSVHDQHQTGQQETGTVCAHFMRMMDQYGACLVYERHPVLQEMLKRDRGQKQKILQALESSAGRDGCMQRRQEVEEQLRDIEILLDILS